MNSREHILNNIKKNQPHFIPLQAYKILPNKNTQKELWLLFAEMAKNISADFYTINTLQETKKYCQEALKKNKRVITTCKELHWAEYLSTENLQSPKNYFNVYIAIIEASLAIAENGALWIDTNNTPCNVLPFITQNLILLISAKKIVANMHQAYNKIKSNYTYGVFIAGPSKTADIEQSLVIGAHGAMDLKIMCILG